MFGIVLFYWLVLLFIESVLDPPVLSAITLVVSTERLILALELERETLSGLNTRTWHKDTRAKPKKTNKLSAMNPPKVPLPVENGNIPTPTSSTTYPPMLQNTNVVTYEKKSVKCIPDASVII